LDGFDSYHEPAPWGVDVLKVGPSLGIGSLAFWSGDSATRVEKTDSIRCRIENRKNKAKVFVDYYGWQINGIKTDLFSTLEIEEGSYLTRYSVGLSEALPNLATGIVKLPETVVKVFEDIKPGWTCLVTCGVQTLQQDHLGMCVFCKTSDIQKITEDRNSHVVVLKPDNNQITYYFGAAWQQDESGVRSLEEFKSLLTEQAKYIK
jgi:hypothetical protein